VIGLGFSDRQKLKKTDDFSSVFNFRRRICGNYLACHYKPNAQGTARLGLIVGKKTARRAVARNYIRRVLRELFRHEQQRLAGLDLVIRVQKPFAKTDMAAIQAEFQQLLQKLPGAVVTLPEQMHGTHTDLAG